MWKVLYLNIISSTLIQGHQFEFQYSVGCKVDGMYGKTNKDITTKEPK